MIYSNLDILIIEPNNLLKTPYSYIPSKYKIVRVSSVELASRILINSTPKLAILSASLPLSENLNFLSQLRKSSISFLISLLIIIDLTNRISMVPGTLWGGKISVIDSLIPESDFNTVLSRLYKK